jgi:hypothetical protein
VNTIHSSSIAHYPVAYSKPRTGRIDDNVASTVDARDSKPVGQRGAFNAPPSSTEQIKTALIEAGLAKVNTNTLPNNTRTQQALNAYTQNYNQTAQRRVAEIISGIDLYA